VDGKEEEAERVLKVRHKQRQGRRPMRVKINWVLLLRNRYKCLLGRRRRFCVEGGDESTMILVFLWIQLQAERNCDLLRWEDWS